MSWSINIYRNISRYISPSWCRLCGRFLHRVLHQLRRKIIFALHCGCTVLLLTWTVSIGICRFGPVGMTVVSEQTPAEQTWSALHLFLNEVISTIFNENLILYNDVHSLTINFFSKSSTSI